MESAIYRAKLVLCIEQLAVLDVHFELMSHPPNGTLIQFMLTTLKNLERKGTTYYELVYNLVLRTNVRVRRLTDAK